MRTSMIFRKIALTIVISIFCAGTGFAGGLNTPFGEVLVENLSLGAEYSMEKGSKTPLVINNTSGIDVNLKIEVLVPQEGEIKEGFEPIPDISWIKLSKTEFLVKPGEAAKTDVIISIPKDKKYMGKKYQVYIWSHTVGRAVGVGLKSRLLLTIEQDAG